MKVLRTTTCGRHGHPEFRIAYDPAVDVVPRDAEWFLGWLEESVAEGTRYKAGQTCQVGWLVTEVRQDESGDLALWEKTGGRSGTYRRAPDFDDLDL